MSENIEDLIKAFPLDRDKDIHHILLTELKYMTVWDVVVQSSNNNFGPSAQLTIGNSAQHPTDTPSQNTSVSRHASSTTSTINKSTPFTNAHVFVVVNSTHSHSKVQSIQPTRQVLFASNLVLLHSDATY
ncbi:unnamed protein product [Ceratitis capitata]|uniref:(Mediterranean fruit fly) hypothetical protein n=1 Tax=Ceratitis capitata TaxID=7213 RepID=A0A811UPR6_CERCA|nr:unnamed protein product [Ceratitis capitata]